MSPSKTSFSVLFLDKKSVFLGIVLLGTVLAIGVLIGYYGKGDNQNNDTPKKSLIQDYVTDQFKKNHVSFYQNVYLLKMFIIYLYNPIIMHIY